MERTYIKDLSAHVGELSCIEGWVAVRRDQGKMVFFDFHDMTGTVQGVVLPSEEGAIAKAKETKTEYVVRIEGTVNKRPEKNVQVGKLNGDIELEVKSIEILSEASDLPFELGTAVNLDTHLDYLPYTLRSERSKDIFKLQATIVEAFRQSMKRQDFTEFQAPLLVGGDAEGGAAAFKVDYYYDQVAFLATSPQFYKQIMAGVFERAFTVAKIFRGEKHATTRHLSEATCMDFEMCFVQDHTEPMRVLETSIRDIVTEVTSKHADIFPKFGTTLPLLPSGAFPVLTLREAQAILGAPEEPDLEPEQERAICEWAKTEKGSDFIFITAFPTSKRAFYTYEEPSEAPMSRGFDLLFRGLEINSGAQRIHNYDALVKKMIDRGLDPEKFSFYLQAFKYGIPPHGGSSTGLERMTARMLELPNVKEATLFPRDINRIDKRLSE